MNLFPETSDASHLERTGFETVGATSGRTVWTATMAAMGTIVCVVSDVA